AVRRAPAPATSCSSGRVCTAATRWTLHQVSNSAIYQYTAPGSERKRNVPPGDVLLAAALAAGLSLDEKLGLVRQANDIEILRAQLAEMRDEMASLRAVVTGSDGTPVDRVAAAD